ncbi:sulfotransferase family protein [Thiobacillus sp.]
MNNSTSDPSKAFLFVTGFPRSGTTWTNSIFLHCFKCGFANEIQFLLQFHQRLNSYGDLQIESNMDRLVSDLLADEYFRILKKSYKVEISKSELLGQISSNTYANLMHAVLQSVAAHLGKEIVGGKCPSLGWDLDAVYAMFPNAKVVNVVRDGRDCALSHYRMSWGFRNAYVAARQWLDYMQRTRAAGERVGPGQYMEFRYEDLLRNPAHVLARLELFILGREDASIHACALAEIGDNGFTGNFNKWKTEMSPREQAIFESEAGSMLEKLGYELTGRKHSVSMVEAGYWWLEDRVRREFRALMRRLFPSIGEKRRVR